MEDNAIQFDDGAGHQLLAVRSRAGLIVTVGTTTWSRLARIELDAEQARELCRFLGVTDLARSSS